MASARNAVPRSLLPLLLVLAVAVAWLAIGERGGRHRPEPAGGPGADAIVPFPAADVVRLEATLAGREVVLARSAPDQWRLEGGVVDDVDPASVRGLLEKLCAETASAPLPGGEKGDAADLGLTPSAARLRVASAGGAAVDLQIGEYNPVLDRCYAQGAGRAGVFTISTDLVSLLRELPDSVRRRWLWPAPAFADVETLARRPAGAAAADLFARDERGRWWLRAPADGPRRVGPLFADYDRLYGDRRRVEGGASWWRASDRALADLVFRLGETQVRRFGPAQAPPETLRALGLAGEPLAVRIALRGGVVLRARFGPGGPGADVWAQREDYPGPLLVVASGPAAAAAPLAALVNIDALPFTLDAADSLTVERPDRPGVVRVWREGKKWRLRAAPSAAAAESAAGARRAPGPRPEDVLGDLVTTLERLPLVRPLPPAPAGHDPLAAPYRAVLTVWSPGEGAATAQLGLLAAGSGERAACWSPATGRLVEVPREILGTIKGMFLAMGF